MKAEIRISLQAGSNKDSKKESVYDCILNETSVLLDIDDSPLISTDS